NAIRSPLTEIEDRGEMTAEQLESTIDATLREAAHPRATLTALLAAMHPINKVDGFTAEIVLDSNETLVDEMRQVLVAGSIIGAVRRAGQDRSRFLVHAAFARYLAMAQRKPWKVKTEDVDRRELVNVIGVALLPDPKTNADVVLSEMHPISDAQGFAAETQPFKIADEATKRLVINTLGAGATISGAVRRNNDDGRYFVSTDFYKTLLLMRADVIPRFNTQAMAQRYSSPSIGYRPPTALQAEPVPRLEDQAATPRLPRRLEAAAGPAQSVPPVPPPVPGQQRGPANDVRAASSQFDTNLADEIRGDIIHLGGLHAWSDREISIARAIGIDSEPEEALRRLAARAPRLAGLVGQTIDENRSSLREAYEYLLANNGQDATYRQVLETVANELDDLMPLLMLTPGGPYQQILEHVLIAGLERQAGDGTLTAADDLLLGRARAQVMALKGLSDNGDDRYKRIVRIIDQYDERPQQAAPLQSVKPERRASG
ncbi:MAG: hypothetical protein JSS20_12630, partial [Proteobacteria bacterium]|nr:hypothetical protein [Pseudomonadota bacterium]